MNIRSLTRGDGAVIGAAVLLLISSFLPYFSFKTGDGDKSASSWSPALFPLLPTVTLAALASAALFVFARSQPAGRQLIGLTLPQWGTALAVFVGWSALWSTFSTIVPSAAGNGANDGISKGAGAWLTLIFGLGMAAAAVLADRLPALKAPLMGAPRPAQAPYGVGGPAGAQPYAAGPPQAGYGYPGGPQSVDPFGQGGQPAQGQQQPYGAQAPQPAAAAPAPAGDFTAFWFAVPVPRPLFDENNPGAQIAELTPGTWYLAVEQRGAQLIAQTQDGRRGVLQDSSGIQRG
ncbi:hypothetical protein AB0M29_37210 [Streptomyces sp. NPDC051976]|uniref:hypothetical protein n=1 Tax=Streptomyces sp. NPDC051976 TaxID=3154947 RepID=UPI00341A1624